MKTDFHLSTTIDTNKVFLIHRSELEGRLDPFYSKPAFMELEAKVKQRSNKKLRDFIKRMAGGATPTITERDKYYAEGTDGIPFIRVQNLTTSSNLNLADIKFINLETHNGMLRRSQVTSGDLLVKITGVGRMATSSVTPDNFTGNINQHIVVVKTGDKHTSEVLAAYLNSDIGERLASRRSTGGTRPALDYPALRSIPVIYNPKIVQIANIAYKLKAQKEAEAQKLLDSIDDYLLSELGIRLPEDDFSSLEARMFYRKSRQIQGRRFDPKRYDAKSQALVDAVNSARYSVTPLKALIMHCVAGDWGYDENDIYIDSNKFERCLVIRGTEFYNRYNLRIENSRTKHRLIYKQRLKQLDIQPNDILIEKSGGSDYQPDGRVALI